MGFNELLYGQPENETRELTELNLEAQVYPGGYLWIVLRKNEDGMQAFRLSRHGKYPSGYFKFDASGELKEETRFNPTYRSAVDGWNDVRIVTTNQMWVLKIDHLEQIRVPQQPSIYGHFGFKGSGTGRAPVMIRNINVDFRNPQSPNHTWREIERFSELSLSSMEILGIIGFSCLVLLLRELRRPLLFGLLTLQARWDYTLWDQSLFLALLLIQWMLPSLPSPKTLLVLLFVSELLSFTILALQRKKHAADALNDPPIFRFILYVAITTLISVATASKYVEPITEGTVPVPTKLSRVHPDAIIVIPDRSHPSPPIQLDEPRVVAPGAPFFIDGHAYREVEISVAFGIRSNCTMDVVFQQQSFLTLGDPEGEALPYQRRLVRVSTLEGVPTGLSTRTDNRPAPFVPLSGHLHIGEAETNLLTIVSHRKGTTVVLNGATTSAIAAGALGYGEVGVMVFEEPAILHSIQVKPVALPTGPKTLAPWIGGALPMALSLVFLLLLRSDRTLSRIRALSLGWAALFPCAVLLLTAWVFLHTKEPTVVDQMGWVDLALAASVCSHLAVVVFLRKKIRHPALLFNLGFFLLFCCVGHLIWSQLPQEHLLKLRFSDTAKAPGATVPDNDDLKGPWYSNNLRIGSNIYVWKQELGGERILREKPKGVVRIFVVGGSQAWGSGAADSSQTFAEQLEDVLLAKQLPVEVFNAGNNGAGMISIFTFYEEVLRRFHPDILVADIGLNDSAALYLKRSDVKRAKLTTALLTSFEQLLNRCRAEHTKVLLCLEPMCRELPLRPYRPYYEGLEKLAAEHAVPVVHPFKVTAELERTRIIWWDSAHLTPYGHRLLAQLIEPKLEPMVRALVPGTP